MNNYFEIVMFKRVSIYLIPRFYTNYIQLSGYKVIITVDYKIGRTGGLKFMGTCSFGYDL